jgi:hypothetical protein
VPITDQISSTPRTIKSVKRNANLLKWVRQVHLWLGVFFAPAIIFFAFSGALQTFSFHEAEPGSTYHPPVWIQKLAQIHKKQTIQIRQKPPAPPQGRRNERETPRPKIQQPLSTTLLKWFVFLMALGLITTSTLGVYMAFQYTRDRRMIWALLVLGTIIPALFIR